MDNKAVRKYLMSKLDTVQREAEIIQAAIKSLDAETETQAAPAQVTKKEAAPATKTTTKKGKAPAVETDDEAVDGIEAEAEESEESDLDLDSEDTEAEVTIDTVRQTVKKFALKHGKDKALKLLQKFKTTSISDLKKPDYAKVIELAEKHM